MYKILIVDDSQTNVLFSQSLLGRETNYHLDCFNDPFAALQCLQRKAFDLALIDYHMPSMNGVELIRAIRRLKHCRNQPIIMVTSEDEKEVLQEAFRAGANDFLLRPFSQKEYYARIESLLQLWDSRKQLEKYVRDLEDAIATAARKIGTA